MANSQRRMVYSKIWTSEQFGKLSDKAKLLFIGTITLADDDGRLRGNPAYLRGQVFPYDEELNVAEVLQFRNEIEKSGLFSIYSINNLEYIQHPKWTEYQIIRKDLYKESSLPPRTETVTKPLRKRSLSKVKLSKVKSNSETEVSQGISLVIDLFKDINPTYKKWFGNTTQRKAVTSLLERHGFEQLRKVIALLPKTNTIQYLPTITTPLQLEDKWSSLEAGLTKEKNKITSKGRGLA